MYNFKHKDGNKEILGVCVLFGVITRTPYFNKLIILWMPLKCLADFIFPLKVLVSYRWYIIIRIMGGLSLKNSHFPNGFRLGSSLPSW